MFGAATTPPRLLTLILLCALSVSSLNMFLPSLSHMATDLGADYSLISVSIAGYLAVTAVLQLIMGPLSDRLGRRLVMLLGLSIFTVASAVCALTTSIWVFLAFRVLQGGVIAGWALSLAVIRDTAPPRQAASRIGYLSMAMALGPMLGPVLGGTLDELFGWRANFATYTLFGLAMLLVCWVDLGETNRRRSETFKKQFAAYPKLLGSTRFWGYASCTAFSTAAFYAFITGVPLVATEIFALSPAQVGVCIGSITVGFMAGSFVSGRIAGRYPLTGMMIAGRVLACVALAGGLLIVLSGTTDVVLFFGATMLVGMGNGLTTPSSNAGVLSIKPDLAGSAAGLSGALTVGGGAALTWLTGTILTPERGASTLLSIMLVASGVALAAALYVRWADRHGVA